MSEQDEAEKKGNLGAAKMIAEVEVNGVTVASVKDGTVFYMTAEYLEHALKLAQKNKERRIIMFIKHSAHPLRPQ